MISLYQWQTYNLSETWLEEKNSPKKSLWQGEIGTQAAVGLLSSSATANTGEVEFAIDSYTDKCTVSVVESGSYLYTEWQN